MTQSWLLRCIYRHPEIVDPYLDFIANKRSLGATWLEVRALVSEDKALLPPSLQGWLVPSPKLAKKASLRYAMFDRLLRGETYVGDPNRPITAKVESGQAGVRITFLESSPSKLKNAVGYKRTYDQLRVRHIQELWEEFERDIYDDTGWKIEELVPGHTITVHNYRGNPYEQEILFDASRKDVPVAKVIFGAMQCA